MTTELTYKSEDDIRRLARHSRMQHMGALVVLALSAIGTIMLADYSQNNPWTEGAVTHSAFLNWLGLLWTLFLGVLWTFLVVGLALGFCSMLHGTSGYSLKPLAGDRCVQLSNWIAEHREIKKYVQEVNAKRHLAHFDFYAVNEWVHNSYDSNAQQIEKACKNVHGIS